MSEYLSVHKGSKVDEAVTMVREDNCKVKYGNIIGTLNDQTDLQNALDARVNKTTTINGHALNMNVTLVPNDIYAADNNMSNLTATGINNLRGYCLSTLGGTVSGNISASGNLTVTGTTTLTGAVTVNNAVTASSLTAGSITSGNIEINGSGKYLLLHNPNVNYTRIQLPTAGNGIEVKLGDGSDYAPIKGSNITATGALNVTGATTLSGALTVNNNINGITPTEFNCLDNVSSNIQTQIDNIKIPDSTFKATLLNALYPVNSIYITVSTSGTCPIASTLGGTWQLVSTDRVLQGASSASGAGGTKAAGLPTISGSLRLSNVNEQVGAAYAPKIISVSGSFNRGNSISSNYVGGSGASMSANVIGLNANGSSSIYGSSSTVQPPAYLVNVWQRTA